MTVERESVIRFVEIKEFSSVNYDSEMEECILNCIELLEKFLLMETDIDTSLIKKVEARINEFNKVNEDRADVEYSSTYITTVIIDLFKLNSKNLKRVTDFCIKQHLQMGRRHKKILLRYLDYRNENDLELFFKELEVENVYVDKKLITEFITNIPRIKSKEAVRRFLELWNEAVRINDESKISDYLFGIYSKLHAMNNDDTMSKIDIFKYNEGYIKGDLSPDSIADLKCFCEDEYAEESFYKKYVSLLRRELQQQSLLGLLEPSMNQKQEAPELYKAEKIVDRKGDLHYLLTEEYDAVYLRINQSVFDSFDRERDFYNYVLDAVQQAFRILVNNKVFAVEIDNIYSDNRNLKWLLYAYIGVYAERFIRTEEKRKFYAADKIAKEMFRAYGIVFNVADEENINVELKKYYSAKKEETSHKAEEALYELVTTNMKRQEFHDYLEEWKFVYYGFTFNDCFVIRGVQDTHEQYADIVKNDNKLLFIFYKYRMDERKIPCPVCNGLNVSGNSYPEIGHRSWECKNVICKSRSKSNRGKRYSFKTNYMQAGSLNLDSDNLIPKEMIARWRKDIAFIESDKDIYEMFIKYFSFPDERILFINGNAQILSELTDLGRNLTHISCLESFKGVIPQQKKIQICTTLFEDYFERGKYLARFIRDKDITQTDQHIGEKLTEENDAFIFNGDSFEILQGVPEHSVAAAVTSPPYFNAREYSQWENMYLYYIDMYNIAKNTLPTLDESGIFLYNIGDVNGNEMTIAKSNMGIKRLLLGAYSVLAFEKAGYELVENYIWNKGEPQSKRSTNDGNFTPHYQKPVNCYEHMFIFKRRGDKLQVNANKVPTGWASYVADFMPVFKINSKGENRVGHTAPYPEDIPNFVACVFGRSGKFILDPFLGSGTSIVSAVKNGYVGVGIEYSREYAELAKRRFEEDLPGKIAELV